MLNAPAFSPSVTTNVQNSSPAKMVKRTSLGDYMARKKKKDEALAQAQAQQAHADAPPTTSSSPSSWQTTITSAPPSLATASSGTAIEKVDMPLAPARPPSAEEKENKPGIPTVTTTAS
jgi:hypothetical protein